MLALMSGCAHQQLRRTLGLGVFESKSVPHLQEKANAAFPAGLPMESVRARLGADSGEVAPVLMFLTLRPWPFDPWAVGSTQNNIRVWSEDDRNWFLWWTRRFVVLDFEFNADGKLDRVTVRRQDSTL